uniref:Uncharacterized protein n=1 Tax=Caenorhabditis japonica TaxID=281687 RepID=A0A8R1IN88_CAEJA
MSKRSKKSASPAAKRPPKPSDEQPEEPAEETPGETPEQVEDATVQKGESLLDTLEGVVPPAMGHGLRAMSVGGDGSSMEVDEDDETHQADAAPPAIGHGSRAMSVGGDEIPIEKDDTKNLGRLIKNPIDNTDEDDILNPLIGNADLLDKGMDIPIIEFDELDLLGEAPAPAPQPGIAPEAQPEQMDIPEQEEAAVQDEDPQAAQ